MRADAGWQECMRAEKAVSLLMPVVIAVSFA